MRNTFYKLIYIGHFIRCGTCPFHSFVEALFIITTQRKLNEQTTQVVYYDIVHSHKFKCTLDALYYMLLHIDHTNNICVHAITKERYTST